MTTDAAPEATTETENDPFADAKCSNCGDPVKRRRPSLTGKHFCAKKGCQRAKHRFHHRRRADGAAESEAKRAEAHEKMLLAFVAAVANADRIDCETCGRRGVVPGYAHPVPDWTAACNPPDKLSISGSQDLSTKLVVAVYPR